jgi:hypothetical protein
MLLKNDRKNIFVGEISFGPRGNFNQLNSDGTYDELELIHFIYKNLYTSYAATVLTSTAGFMGTFIGYEVIFSAEHFHYSRRIHSMALSKCRCKKDYAVTDKNRHNGWCF